MDERDAIEQAYKNGFEAGVKEFAERLEEKVTYYEDECGEFVPWVDCRDIDTIAEEMCGKDEGNENNL